MSEISEESKLRKLQAHVFKSWCGEKNSPFEKGVFAALNGWDKQSTFVILELGCGTGGNSVSLINRAKELVREANADASLRVYQMDLPSINRDDIKIFAEQWVDDKCESFFLPQSFYDEFKLDEKANLIFSQSALHWMAMDVEPSVLSKEAMNSESTREVARTLFRRVLKNIEGKVVPGGALAVLCLGGVGDALLPVFSRMVDVYGAGFRGALSGDDATAMMRVPQVPHRLDDVKEEICKNPSATWVFGGAVYVGGMPAPSEDIARMAAKGMLSVFWPDLFKKLWPDKAAECEAVMEKAQEAMAAAIMQYGLFSSADPSPATSTITFVAHY